MLGAFNKHYCMTCLDPNFDPIWPNFSSSGGYNASDCGRYTPPRVISISYVYNEAQFTSRYTSRQCLEFLKLGLQGVTVLAATRDRGTVDQRGHCIDPATGNRTDDYTDPGLVFFGFPGVLSVGYSRGWDLIRFSE